jgi:hypothetical protein
MQPARFIGLSFQPNADLRRRRISLWLTPSLRRSPAVPFTVPIGITIYDSVMVILTDREGDVAITT